MMKKRDVPDVTQARHGNCIKSNSDFLLAITVCLFFLTSGRALTSGDLGRVCDKSRNLVTSKAIS